jgi:DNA-binding response OmpR family regulator
MRVLVVEDEHKIAGAIKRGLEQEAFAVDLAYDADEGVGLATTEDYDVVILDRMLPGLIEGVEIVQEMRRHKIHTPVLLLTAKDQIRDRVTGLNAGADDYLVKPFAFEELLARVRALLRRPADTQGMVLRCGDLSLDTVNFEVRRGKHLIKLSHKEFALLEYLIRNQGQTLTKNNIIAHVWDYDADILPNTVEVYVGYLRNKIDKPFGARTGLLQTVRGFGYRLQEPA